MSLYRTYRPQSFADVVGQDPVVTTLEQAAKQDKLSHAYLFAGSRGTGKTSVARILAKILMIRGVEDENIQKQIIRGVEDGSLVDLLEIDAASNTSVDNIRELIEKVQFSPVVAGAKVYIIDEVHMLSKSAFNALLKTLEEPPAYAYFILATTEINKIPLTIQSRCQCFPFRAIDEEEIVRRLQYIADQEHIVIDREALRTIAHHVHGGMRDAISLLDQMRSLPKISRKDVEQRIGATGDEHVETIITAIEKKDASAIIEAVRKIEEAGIALDVFLRKLLDLVRTRLHEAIASKQSTIGIQRVLDALLDAIRSVRIAPVPGLVVESALLHLCSDADGKKEEPLHLAAKAEPQKAKTKKPETAKQDPETVEKKEDVQSAAIKSASVEAPELSLDAIRGVWEDIVAETSPASVKMSLKNGRVLSLEEKKVILGFSSSFHRDKVAHPEASRTIEEIMQRIFKRSLKVECVVGDGGNNDAVHEEAAVDLAEAAAEVF
ncbi:TPA: DNA polymerase III, subunit gamma and tau [Candidatus Peribacteria bacterium]|nr:MAG: DNA polymerase III, subunit gamma and tau [Candidatus Peribacteria bacterium RIFOXYD2_FULL_58_15]HAI98412.1 DNA polymerase III, subunit gamma and tau [Candidatus Peribacteria bacterium]HAS33833.1 DNA polymerase III, subunit gamma and tau [Candidatus Peribacteria bacterium]